jgi:hypothetical protein
MAIAAALKSDMQAVDSPNSNGERLELLGLSEANRFTALRNSAERSMFWQK